MMTLTFPNWRLMRTVWESPRLPLWNPGRSLGEPHLADPQTMALYPPMILLSAGGDFAGFLRLWAALHAALAALSMGALARRLTGSAPAAAAAALLAAGNGFFLARLAFTNHLAAAAWLPAVLYSLEVGSPLGLGACLAMQWLAGFPPFSLVTLALAAFWAGRQGRAGWRCLLQGGLWAAGLAAAQLLPFLELLANSTRRVVLPPEAAAAFSVPGRQLLKELLLPQWSSLAPGLSGDPAIVTFYVGLLALGLAGWGLVRGGRREAGLALAAMGACLLSLGPALPGYGALPFLRVFRFPANWLLAAAAALALLCAAGIASLKEERSRWLAVAAIGLDLLLFAQPARVAWAKPAFLTEEPSLARARAVGAGPRRIYHTARLYAAWQRGSLREEEDYLLMRDFLAPSYGTAFGLQEVLSYQTLAPRLSRAYAARLASGPLPSPLLDWAGVGEVVDLAPGAHEVTRQGLRVLRNASAWPRVFPADAASARVDLVAYAPGLVRAAVRAVRPATVVFSETDYPGWRAFVDGRPAAHSRFEGVFPAVAVPAGLHEVSFRFSSPSFLLGAMITLATLLGMGWLRLRRRA